VTLEPRWDFLNAGDEWQVFLAIGDKVEQVHLAALVHGTTRTHWLFSPGEGTGAGVGTATVLRVHDPATTSADPSNITTPGHGRKEKRAMEVVAPSAASPADARPQ
jgi:hypothetical protein